ncbi:MAG: hypothetical protein J6S21_04870, partial [Victivallales bacterium]|nr:hypothetical protein [Victivallales bacterium]
MNTGDEVCFEAWTKVDNLKTVCAELQFFGNGGSWLRRGSGQIARGDQYSWQKISGSYVITDPEVKAVSLQFYGQGNVDDVKIWRLVPPPDNGDASKAAADIQLHRKSDADYIFLSNEAYEAWISRKRGLM